MILWRISTFDDLIGLGGELSTGRWHTAAAGKRIVYLAEHPALAIVESLVNLFGNQHRLPETFQLLRIEVPEETEFDSIQERLLPQQWHENFAQTQALGDDWLQRNETALLAVPSAPSPESTNYLLNPRHPDAPRIAVVWSRWLRYNRRLFRLSE